jgi:hypothetical protein
MCGQFIILKKPTSTHWIIGKAASRIIVAHNRIKRLHYEIENNILVGGCV